MARLSLGGLAVVSLVSSCASDSVDVCRPRYGEYDLQEITVLDGDCDRATAATIQRYMESESELSTICVFHSDACTESSFVVTDTTYPIRVDYTVDGDGVTDAVLTSGSTGCTQRFSFSYAYSRPLGTYCSETPVSGR